LPNIEIEISIILFRKSNSDPVEFAKGTSKIEVLDLSNMKEKYR